MYQQYLESKQTQEEEKKKREKETKEKKTKKQKKNQEKLLPTAKNRTGKLASRVNSQCLYHDVLTTYLCHFLPNGLRLLKDIIQDIITTSTSPQNRCTKTPIAKFYLEVASWTTTCKAITSGSSLVLGDNVGEDELSSQSTYKVNIDCPYYKASNASNQKILNDLNHQKNSWKSLWGNYERSE
jgi:hypothetical protein